MDVILYYAILSFVLVTSLLIVLYILSLWLGKLNFSEDPCDESPTNHQFHCNRNAHLFHPDPEGAENLRLHDPDAPPQYLPGETVWTPNLYPDPDQTYNPGEDDTIS